MRILRDAGRILATVVSTLWLFIMVMGAIEEGAGINLESGLMLALILINATATAIVWWRVGLGAILLLLGGLAFAAFALWSAGSHHAFAMATSGGPYILAGLAVHVGERCRPPAR
ncbi:MAG: hypothetical protein ACP5G7_03000 [Anaerolineae bacterium]